MQALDLPLFGNLVLCAILVCAAYSFGVCVVAGRRPALLPAARASTRIYRGRE